MLLGNFQICWQICLKIPFLHIKELLAQRKAVKTQVVLLKCLTAFGILSNLPTIILYYL